MLIANVGSTCLLLLGWLHYGGETLDIGMHWDDMRAGG
jgi:hypothetical protein